MGMPLAVAVRLLPTPTAVTTWRTPAEHMAWRHHNGRTGPCDLQVAVVLQVALHDPGGRLQPTPDTGTSPAGHGRRGGRPGNGHQNGHDLDAVARALHPLLAAAGTRPSAGPGRAVGQPDGQQAQAGATGVDWGPYEAAVRRWEHALGCPAPPPAERVPGERLRLAAAFAEWLMGIPGWVTQVAGISRTAQLRIIGNGVVPQQAAAAVRLLIQAACAVPSDPGRAGEQEQEAAA
jgi:DNA (cytosine-5)-methyltransferase 1